MSKQIKDANGKVVAELLQDEDVDSNLDGKTIAVIGYASQGRGQSLCYRDSGINTILGLRKNGQSWKQALEDGWGENETLFEIPEAVKKADMIVMVIADTAQPEVYKAQIEPNLSAGKTLVFSHGFNIHFKQIIPPADVDVIMVAPKGPGLMVRKMYEEGMGVPSLIAIQQDASGNAKKIALAYAKGIGGTKAGVFETTFKEETETDLFGEQAVLCGGCTALVKAGF